MVEDETLTRILAGKTENEKEMASAIWPEFAQMAGLTSDDRMPEVLRGDGRVVGLAVERMFYDFGVGVAGLPDFSEMQKTYYVVSSDGQYLILNSDADWGGLPYVRASENKAEAINQMKMFCTLRGFFESLARVREQKPIWAIGDVVVDGSYGLTALGKNSRSRERVFLHGFHFGSHYFFAQMACATLGMERLPYWDDSQEGVSQMVQTVMRALRITPRELVTWLRKSDAVSFLSLLVEKRAAVTAEPLPDRWAERVYCLPDAFLSLGSASAIDIMNGLRRLLP